MASPGRGPGQRTAKVRDLDRHQVDPAADQRLRGRIGAHRADEEQDVPATIDGIEHRDADASPEVTTVAAEGIRTLPPTPAAEGPKAGSIGTIISGTWK